MIFVMNNALWFGPILAIKMFPGNLLIWNDFDDMLTSHASQTVNKSDWQKKVAV